VSEPIFLTLEIVLKGHRRSLALYGGLDGIRDQGGLESAVAQPMHTHYYANGDLFDIAAAYMFHIAQAQAFFDGNKRTAVAAGFAFLTANRVTVVTDDVQIYEAVIQIAEHRLDKAGLAALLRASAIDSNL
jgi:death-on-curing protein